MPFVGCKRKYAKILPSLGEAAPKKRRVNRTHRLSQRQGEETMTIDAEILETLLKMPVPLRTELLHYAKYLIEKYSKNTSQVQSSQKKRRVGILKNTFVLPLPDDFDEPLEDFKEYME